MSIKLRLLLAGAVVACAAVAIAATTTGWRYPYIVTRDTGAAAVATTVEFESTSLLDEIRFTMETAGNSTDTLYVTIDSAGGAEYDCVITSVSMNGLTDHHYQPTNPVILGPDDAIDVVMANDTSTTYGIEIVWRRLP